VRLFEYNFNLRFIYILYNHFARLEENFIIYKSFFCNSSI